MTRAVSLRHELHAHPELSGAESATAARVADWFAELDPDEIVTGLGGHGIAVAFRAAADGPTVMLRAELDALPILETNGFAHRSRCDGVSHKCGHDGHMAILAAVGETLAAKRPARGRVVLLFQPAEETGAGAAAVVADPNFDRVRPDRVFGLHNVPGFPRGQVIVRRGTFTCASRGMRMVFDGEPAHAAQPETGRSPTAALAAVLQALAVLPPELAEPGETAFATIVGAQMGGANFGVAPGRAVISTTLRSESDTTMARIVGYCETLADELAARHGLTVTIDYQDVFDATVNAPAAVDTIVSACEGMDLVEVREPFRWSEDFGCLTRNAEGAFFGLGAGEGMPDLHNHDYDFPDALVATGADVFRRIVDHSLEEAPA